MKRACMLALVVIVSLGTRSIAQAQVVNASLNKLEVGLGEPVTLMASVEHAAGSRVEWPTDLGLGPNIEERSREAFAVEQIAKGQRSRIALTLAIFDRSVERIPGFSVELTYLDGGRHTLTIPALAIAIRSNVDPTNAELRPSRDPADAPIQDWNLLIAGLSAVLLLGLFALFFKMKWRAKEPLPQAKRVESVSPHEEALIALDALEASGRLDGEALKAVFHDMSEIMRTYLGRRFGFPALDQTSSEIRSRLRDCPGSHEWGDAMNAWLSRCDLVKYASANVDAEEARTSLYSARVLVDRTKESAIGQERPVEVARA